MAKETVADDGGERFAEKWAGLSDDERLSLVNELRAAQSGSDRKCRELVEQNRELAAQLEETAGTVSETKAAAVNTVEGIANEIATVRAERELVRRQKRMIEKAIEGGIDPALAVRFAETTDADSTFDLAAAEIERKVKADIQQILVDSAHHPTAGDEKPTHITYADIMKMSEAEQKRLPQQVFDRALAEASK